MAELHKGKRIPPMASLFISHVDGEARHHDYTCNSRYARFVAEDLLPWIQNRTGTTPRKHFIGGLSLGGLAAAHVAVLFPDIFGFVLCQSGSLWWNQEWLTTFLGKQPALDGRFWVSVGNQETQSGVSHPPTGLRQETDQISASERFAEELRRKGASVHYHLYEGGHDVALWKQELPEALGWLLGSAASQGEGISPYIPPSSAM